MFPAIIRKFKPLLRRGRDVNEFTYALKPLSMNSLIWKTLPRRSVSTFSVINDSTVGDHPLERGEHESVSIKERVVPLVWILSLSFYLQNYWNRQKYPGKNLFKKEVTTSSNLLNSKKFLKDTSTTTFKKEQEEETRKRERNTFNIHFLTE